MKASRCVLVERLNADTQIAQVSKRRGNQRVRQPDVSADVKNPCQFCLSKRRRNPCGIFFFFVSHTTNNCKQLKDKEINAKDALNEALTFNQSWDDSRIREMKAEATKVVEINERLAEIETKLAPDNVESLKKKQIKNFEKEKVELTAQLETLQNKSCNGWVLCDFPCTYAQAKLLEQALSGYQPEVEQDPIKRDLELADAHLLVQPSAKEECEKQLIASGLDAVLWYNCPINECLRRADGRYYDKAADEENFVMYHVEDV